MGLYQREEGDPGGGPESVASSYSGPEGGGGPEDCGLYGSSPALDGAGPSFPGKGRDILRGTYPLRPANVAQF